MIEAPIYVYTVPKAGTYFLAGLLEELGYINTGWHIATDSYLDTKNFDDTTNREYPSNTKVTQPHLKTFRQIPSGHFAFGHFSPGNLHNRIAKRFSFISSYRHPREVLQSEFIDFRYRRKDVKFVSEAEIPDPKVAFETYLENHGFIIKNIFINFLLFQERYLTPLYREFYGNNNVCFDFKTLIDPSTSGPTLRRVAAYFERSTDEMVIMLEKAKIRDNKTKSVGLELPISRNELWTARAEQIYNELKFVAIEQALKVLENRLEEQEESLIVPPSENLNFENGEVVTAPVPPKSEPYSSKVDLQSDNHLSNELPKDFDAASYLKLNPDVAAKGEDAIKHFLLYGRYEGRVWK